MKMNKLLIMLVCVIVLQGCAEPAPSTEDFDLVAFNRERAAWEKQGIADYVFTVKELSSDFHRGYVYGRITVAENYYLLNIESLVPVEDWFWVSPPEYHAALNNVYVTSRIEKWRSVFSIYDRIFSLYQKDSAQLGKGERLRIKIRYNAKYHYPEYIDYSLGIPGDERVSFVLEIAAFEIKEPIPFIDFDFDTFNREWAAWGAKSIAAYSFVEHHDNIVYPEAYTARVTVADNVVTGIDILSLNDYMDRVEASYKGELGIDPEVIEQGIANERAYYINWVESTVGYWGDISGIYEQIFSRYQKFLAPPHDPNERLRIEIRYNSQHHYPEYVGYFVRNLNQDLIPGSYGILLEISDFEIAK